MVGRRRVLVTGASGSIGDAVASLLAFKGDMVVGFDRRQAESCTAPMSEYIRGDIRDPIELTAAVNRVDCVVHLAGWVHARPRNSDEINDLFELNHDATRATARLCAERGRPIVFASTVSVYGDAASGVLDENAPTKPSTDYGRSKLLAEAHVLEAGGIVLRLPMVYGARDRGNMARMIRGIARGFFFLPGRGEAKRTFVGRWNVAHAIALAVEAGRQKSGIYLVTDDETITIGELADKIAGFLGVRRPPRIPKAILATAAVAGSALAKVARRTMPLEWASYSKLTRDLTFDGTRIRRELGYRPVKSLDEGLREAVAWYRGEMRS